MKMNHRELMTWADRFAKGLSEKDLAKGDVSACNMPTTCPVRHCYFGRP